MSNALRRLPAALALLLLGAHFLRGGDVVLVGLCLVAIPLAFVSRPGVAVVVRGVLVAGAALWLWTAWELAAARRAAGEPHARMLVILLAVAAFSALAAFLLPRQRPRGTRSQ